ncbi:transposase [Sabulicella glaciei]|uniref:transposase n=1 Tax=Sabulicella glaciei TaxID=2984948 RepID=UPI0034A0970C
MVEFEALRAELEEALPRAGRSRGRRPPYDVVLMFRVLVLQGLYALSEEQAEYQLHHQISFMRLTTSLRCTCCGPASSAACATPRAGLAGTSSRACRPGRSAICWPQPPRDRGSAGAAEHIWLGSGAGRGQWANRPEAAAWAPRPVEPLGRAQRISFDSSHRCRRENRNTKVFDEMLEPNIAKANLGVVSVRSPPGAAVTKRRSWFEGWLLRLCGSHQAFRRATVAPVEEQTE